MTLQDITIVLSHPQEEGNIGAVCRAMKNMGLSRLCIVSAECFDGDAVRARAVHAGDLWDRAGRFDSLAGAVGGYPLVIGTTRRRGRTRKPVNVHPERLAQYLGARAGQAALVFGNERAGLGNADLNLCNFASSIPSSRTFPSLNLSHAVQIYAYHLFRVLGGAGSVQGEWTPLDQNALEALVKSVTCSLESLGFYKHRGRTEQERFLRDIFSRAGLSPAEGAYLRGLFAKAAGLGRRARETGGEEREEREKDVKQNQ
ncbi:MAG: TrmJ/YjtD family RNA methyltransferase [Spirochaetaceae bacterium]|jgi:tRNA/rRNA methyltransferase/tRNA (cytidine32/uridine32-2'-O)-methyltransferase|nr:TrmJ/YjtD family RNA methyltransferase [Spirochaetaceae bacterium]